MMNEEDLLPCPFCGGEAKLKHHTGADQYWVNCANCQFDGLTPMMGSYSAIKQWNTRAPSIEYKIINQLRSEEGSSVTIISDNTGFDGPNCSVEVCNSSTDWLFVSFFGKTVTATLTDALSATQAVK